MKKRLCTKQSVVLCTNLNMHISRCENRECVNYLSIVDEEICGECEDKDSIEGVDRLANSMAKDVYDIELDERKDKVVAHLFNEYCKKCQYYDKKEKMCSELKCDYLIPIKGLMRSHNICCPLGLWS